MYRYLRGQRESEREREREAMLKCECEKKDILLKKERCNRHHSCIWFIIHMRLRSVTREKTQNREERRKFGAWAKQRDPKYTHSVLVYNIRQIY